MRTQKSSRSVRGTVNCSENDERSVRGTVNCSKNDERIEPNPSVLSLHTAGGGKPQCLAETLHSAASADGVRRSGTLERAGERDVCGLISRVPLAGFVRQYVVAYRLEELDDSTHGEHDFFPLVG